MIKLLRLFVICSFGLSVSFAAFAENQSQQMVEDDGAWSILTDSKGQKTFKVECYVRFGNVEIHPQLVPLNVVSDHVSERDQVAALVGAKITGQDAPVYLFARQNWGSPAPSDFQYMVQLSKDTWTNPAEIILRCAN